MTYTLATLELSEAAFNEVFAKLRDAGYGVADGDIILDMHGIGVVKVCQKPDEQLTAAFTRAAIQHIANGHTDVCDIAVAAGVMMSVFVNAVQPAGARVAALEKAIATMRAQVYGHGAR